MTPFAPLVLGRLAFAAFSFLTFAYAALNCSPFAFDMFVKPQLFPWLTHFVAWHHLWFAGAYLLSLATLRHELAPGRRSRAHWLAVAYVLGMGAATVALLMSPFLPTLWNDARALPAAIASLVPLAWLAAIDHFAPHGRAPVASPDGTRVVTGHRRLLVACGLTALVIWAAHLARAVVRSPETGNVLAWLVTGAWTLVLTSAFFAGVFTALSLAASLAARQHAPTRAEHGLIVALAAAALSELFRRAVFPTLSLPAADAALLSAAAGLTIAVTWSGLMRRRPAVAAGGPQAATATELLFAPALSPRVALAGILVLAGVTAAGLNRVERLDWNFTVQRLMVVGEGIVAFGLVLRLTAGVTEGRRWRVAIFSAPLLPVLALVASYPAASRLAAGLGDRALDPAVAFERHAAGEIAFRLLAGTLLARPASDDPDYHRFLQEHAATDRAVTVPDVEFTDSLAAASSPRRPDIFVFVVDSLRRDYLAPYNPGVTFTPGIAAFAAESFVFRNAFTRHGGTELAMASIWSGATAVRKVRANQFSRMNALEKLVNAHDYRVAINDFTIAEHLLPTTPKATIDPGVPSVATDLCQNLRSLQAYLDRSSQDPRPVFGYFAPMNVHILNTQRGGQASLDGEYPGFYAPYASRLKRLDACFGEFVAYLKDRGRYDNSIVVLTSDHGDSLGEGGNWGHGMWLYPEDVRLPLIVRVPAALAPHVTTDLARITFSTDIAPTLYALLGRRVRDLGPLFGAPLFVPASAAMPDRRRQSFLLTSSYGATFGLLRRNGRLLYISDLVEWRESAYDLAAAPVGSPIVADTVLRRVSQKHIKEQVADVALLYRPSR